MNVDTIS